MKIIIQMRVQNIARIIITYYLDNKINNTNKIKELSEQLKKYSIYGKKKK